MIEKLTGWNLVLKLARKTVGKKDLNKEPSKKFKLQSVYSEHSPFRALTFLVDLKEIKRWVSGHFVRHKLGLEHYITTQRTDRTGIDRDKLPQDEPTDHIMNINAAAIISISRRRLCKQSSKETTAVWKEVIKQLSDVEPELASVCVPECIYRGFCPEANCCGYSDSQEFKDKRKEYINQCMSVKNKRKN